MDRKPTPAGGSVPPPSDVARLRVALYQAASKLGIDLDSSMADHQIAELIAHRLSSDPYANLLSRAELEAYAP